VPIRCLGLRGPTKVRCTEESEKKRPGKHKIKENNNISEIPLSINKDYN